jgi:hypothetical protein
MPFENWSDTRRDLVRALEALADREFLILGERAPAIEARHGNFRHHCVPAPTRYVQVLRIGDVFSAECVGAASLGGTWEMDAFLIEHLRGMGWLTPHESRAEYGNTTPNFDQYVERSDLRALTGLLISSLQLLGALPGDLELQTQPGWAAEGIG